MFDEIIKTRRSIRRFNTYRKVNDKDILKALEVANSAPSGANRQPWFFVVVSDSSLKNQIRKLAEIEEKEFYSHRAPKELLDAIHPLGTNHAKPHLEEASHLIIVFSRPHESIGNETKQKNYYVKESVGIAVGMMISALTLMGIGSLTHTPNPMSFLNALFNLGRDFQPYMILAVGYPHPLYQPPTIRKKEIHEVVKFYNESSNQNLGSRVTKTSFEEAVRGLKL